jgi:hypothetical protein
MELAKYTDSREDIVDLEGQLAQPNGIYIRRRGSATRVCGRALIMGIKPNTFWFHFRRSSDLVSLPMGGKNCGGIFQ